MISVILNLLKFMTQNTLIASSVFHMYLKRIYVLLLLCMVFYKCQLKPVGWWSFSFLYPWFSVNYFCQLLREWCCIVDWSNSPFIFSHILLHVFGTLDVKCSSISGWYAVFVSCPSHHDAVIVGNFLCS